MLTQHLNESKLDILAVSESKLDDNISDAELSIPNFKLFRIDRNRHGGGVAIYCHENLSSFLLTNLNSTEFESLWVKIKLYKNKPFFLCVSYRSPSIKNPLEYTKNFCNYLTTCVKNLPKGSEVFCLGDFNANWSSNNALTSLMKDFSRSTNLSQIISSPTRITEHSSTIIDLIFTNSLSISSSGSIFYGLSDHNLIFCVRKCNKPKIAPKLIFYRTFKDFDKKKFIADLKSADWSRFLDSSDVDEATSIFNSIVTQVSNVHAPIRQQKIKGNSVAWVNDEFLNAIHERDYLFKLANASGKPDDWENFRIKRNMVNRLKTRLRNSYYRNEVNNSRDDPKKLWKKIKELIPDKTSSAIPDMTLENGNVISDSKDIANQFNDFFVNVGANLAAEFPKSDTSKINVSGPLNSFQFTPFSKSDVRKILNSLDCSKASGSDGISARLLKEASCVLSEKLCFIFNLSLTTGKVPTAWKIKRVSPIFKAGRRDIPGNYRPVSVASTSMKIFEKLVYNQMMSFISKNNILHTNQSGFRTSFSTSSASLIVKEHIIKNLESKKFVCAVLIDLSKAFDTVDHTILLKKLFCYGFRDISFEWCKSYLECRQQQVLVNNTLSDFLIEKPYGVPQGSVLGPLFFLLYINDIHSTIKQSYCHLYADDTIILQAHNDLSSLISNMELELSNVENWLNLNKLTPNIKKCETIFFANKHNQKFCRNGKVKFKGKELETKESVKYLGVHFDSKLSWEKQIKEVIRKINCKLYKIRPLAKFLDPVDINMLIRSFIFPYIHYCSSTWASAAPHLINKIQATVNKTQFFCKNINEIKVCQRLDLDIAILTFKALNNLTPIYISNKLTTSSQIHNYNTRHSKGNNIFHEKSVNKFSSQSLNSICSRVWNSLPTYLKSEVSFLRFKSNIKKYLL